MKKSNQIALQSCMEDSTGQSKTGNIRALRLVIAHPSLHLGGWIAKNIVGTVQEVTKVMGLEQLLGTRSNPYVIWPGGGGGYQLKPLRMIKLLRILKTMQLIGCVSLNAFDAHSFSFKYIPQIVAHPASGRM
jgi:uncharacterized protein (DUF885 family)